MGKNILMQRVPTWAALFVAVLLLAFVHQRHRDFFAKYFYGKIFEK